VEAMLPRPAGSTTEVWASCLAATLLAVGGAWLGQRRSHPEPDRRREAADSGR
jgi:MYXO-CTERM domain-containing protein